MRSARWDVRSSNADKFRSALCGCNITLGYPQPAHFPTLDALVASYGSGGSAGKASGKLTKGRFVHEAQDRLSAKLRERGEFFMEHGERRHARDVWKRDLAGRANGTLDP